VREVAGAARVHEVGSARTRADAGAMLAEEHDLNRELLALPEPIGVLRAAETYGGLLVVADRDGWRVPKLLRTAIAARRPVLLVPAR